MPALKPTGKIAVDAGGEGTTSSPSYLKLVDKAGTAYYLFVDSTGDLKIGTAIPDGDETGTVVGTQS